MQNAQWTLAPVDVLHPDAWFDRKIVFPDGTERATHALSHRMPDAYVQGSVGTRLRFSAE